jgi:hypothetical protein
MLHVLIDSQMVLNLTKFDALAVELDLSVLPPDVAE